MFGRVLAVLRRQWWLVVAVVLAAAITGYVASLKTADVYTSVATIMMDTAPSARYRGMPVADDLVKEITGSKVRSMVEVAGNLRAAAAGNPLTTIRVTYAAGTKDRADAGARAAALEAIAYVRTTMSKEVAFREQQIAASEQALSAFDAASRQTPLALNAT
jgi:hypothetical protein